MRFFTNVLFRSVLSFLMLLLCVRSVNAQVPSSANYSYTTGTTGNLNLDMNGNTIDLSNQPDLTVLGLSSTLATMDIGFDYWFMGSRYFQLSPIVRGAIGLGSLPPYTTTPLPNLNAISTTSAPMLAALWNQSAFTSGAGRNCRSTVVGTAPNRCFVFEWRCLAMSGSLSSGADLTFQCRLYEKTGVIEYVYGNLSIPTNNVAGIFQAAIGFTTLQNYDNTVVSVNDLSTYTNTTLVANVNNAVVLQNQPGAIAGLGNGRFFRWTPLVPAAPTGLSFTNVTPTTTTLNWTDNANNEFGYAIYRSDDGGSNFNFITQTAKNVNTFTQSFLAPSTNYIYRVFAVSEGGNSNILQGSQTTTAGGTITSTSTGGAWSATSTWVGGIIPTINDNVNIANGANVIIDIPNAYCNNLTVGGGTSGILRYSSQVASTLFANGNVTVAAGAIFDAGTSSIQTHGLVIGGFPTNGGTGNLTVNGTFDMNTVTSPNSGAGVIVTFGGFGNSSISGTGATCDFFSIIVNKGNFPLPWQNPILDVVRTITINAPAISATRLTLTSGTFKLSSASVLTPYFGSQTLCALGGRLWLNNAAAVVSAVGAGTSIGAGSPTINGELRIDAGTMSYGSGNNTMTFTTSTSGGVTYGSRLVMNGGTLNMFGAVSFASSATIYFVMSGGSFNVNPQSANMLGSGTTIFTMGANCNTIWSGGTLTIVNPHAVAGGTSVSFPSTGSGSKMITGGTLQIGDGVSGLASGPLGNTTGFLLSIGAPIWNLVINNRFDLSPTRVCRISGTQVIYNNVTVNANAYLMLSTGGTSGTLQTYGNILNDGILAGVEPNSNGISGVLQFLDTVGTQVVSGSGTFVNIQQLTLANGLTNFGVQSTNNLIFNQNNKIVVNAVVLACGLFTHNNKLVIGRPGVIPILQIGGGGLNTAPGSFSSVPFYDNTSFPTQLNYITCNAQYVFGANNEIAPNVNTINGLVINNPKGIVLDRNLTIVSGLNMTLGNISIGNFNLTLGNGPSNVGSLSYTAGNVICGTSGTFTRWYNAASAPTAVGTTSQFPVGSGVLGEQRHAWIYLNSSTTGLATSGTISVRHTISTGLTSMTPYTENAVTMDTRTNSSWNITVGNGLTLGTTGTFSLALRGDGMATVPFTGTLANITITDATGTPMPGVFSVGSGANITPQANRTGIPSVAALTTYPLYIGAPAANIQNVITAINTGSWNTAGTWSGNTVPGANDNVVIMSGITVNTFGGSPCLANNVLVSPGATLNVDGNTVSFGRNLTLSGVAGNNLTYARLNVSAGTLNILGDPLGGGLINGTATIVNIFGGTVNIGAGSDCSKVLNNSSASSIFNFIGGTINIYGSFTSPGIFNQGGGNMSIYPLGPIGGTLTAAASAPNFSFSLTNSAGLCNAGNITIVDPPFVAGTSSSGMSFYASASSAPFYFTGTHTLTIGDGVSTATNGYPFSIEVYNIGLVALNNLTINSGSTANRYCQGGYNTSTAYGVMVKKTFTINSGSEFRHQNAPALEIGGTMINNGTFTDLITSPLQLGITTGATLPLGNVTLTGNGVFRNALTSPTASLQNFKVALTNPAFRAIIDVNNLSISGTLTLTSGQLDLGSNNMTLGSNVPAAGTLTHSAGSQILTNGGSFTRVYASGALPTSIAAGNAGHYPFGRLNPVNRSIERRDAFIFSSNSGSLSTGGTIKITPTAVDGFSTVSAFNDGTLTGVDNRTNSYWTVDNTGISLSTGNVSLSVLGENSGVLPYPIVANTTLMLSSGIASGTYASNVNTIGNVNIPNFTRNGLTVTDISNTSYYGGAPSSNNAGGNIFSINNGDWNSASTWNTNTVPTASDNVQIMAPHTVVIGAAATNTCKNLTVTAGATFIANVNTMNIVGQLTNLGTVLFGGATVNINTANTVGVGIYNGNVGLMTLNGGTLNVGPSGGGAATTTTFTSSIFNILSGTFNMNGNMAMGAGIFNMSGGALNVDGNSNALATSVPAGTILCNFNGATQNISGGTITIVDPPYTGSALSYNQTTGSAWTNATLMLGDGSSTHTSSAFYTVTTPASTQSAGFGIAITAGSPTFTIVNGNGTNRWATINGTSTQFQNLTINTGCQLKTINTSTATTLNINANLVNNGILTLDNYSNLVFNGSAAQFVSGAGVFRVDTTGTIAANINSLAQLNTNPLGVTFNIGNITIGGNSSSGTFNLAGNIHMGGNTLTLGTSATLTGTLSGAVGIITHTTGGGFARWISPTAAPTAVGTTSQFPLGIMVNGTTIRRDFFVYHSAATITTGGLMKVSHTSTSGTTAFSSYTDGALTGVDTRTNGSWTITNTGITTAGTVSATAQGTGMLFPLTLANITLSTPTGILGGAYTAGSNSQSDPRANRTGMSLTDLTTTAIHIAAPGSNITGNIYTVATGDWSNPSTWSTNTVPTSNDNITINANHYVNMNTNGSCRDLTILGFGGLYVNANTLTVNNNFTNSASGNLNVGGGTLTVIGSAASNGLTNNGFMVLSSGTVNVGVSPSFNRTFNSTIVLAVTGGTLNVNGNIILAGTFNQSGGNIFVDGNDGTSAAGSVPAGTNIVNVTSTTHNVSGGTFTIIDPPFTGTGLAFNYAASTNVNWVNHTMIFGDGISTRFSGATAVVNGVTVNMGFGVSTTTATTTGRLSFHNVIINGNGAYRHVAVATSTSNSLDIGNNLTINAGSELRTIAAPTALTGGVNVAGNIVNNGRLVIGSNTTLGFRQGSTVATLYNQTIGGSGQYLNDTAAVCHPCIANLAINSFSTQGADMSGISGSTILIDQPLGTISSSLTFGGTASYLNLGNKNLTLGGSVSKPGLLSGTFTANNNLIVTTGAITRWFGAASISSPAGVFPIGIPNTPIDYNRVVNITAATALTSGGTITVTHNNIVGATGLTAFTDNGVSIDRRSNSNWVVSVGNGLAGTGLILNTQFSGVNQANITAVTDLRLVGVSGIAAGASGTNAGTALDPIVARSGLDQSTLAGTFYIGGNAVNPLDYLPIGNNTITASQTICPGASATNLTGSNPTGGSGSYAYQWQSSTTSATAGFSNVLNATFRDFTFSANPSTTIWYRRVVNSALYADTSATVLITVLPVVTVNQPANQIVCSGTNSTLVTFTGSVSYGSGTITYNWTNNTTSIGLAASGSGNIAAFTTVNSTFSPIVATITVTPSANGCNGTPKTFTITVNPTPTVTSVTPASRCDAGTVVLGAVANAGTLNWYAVATGGTSLATGTSFTTPSIGATTTYYVDATNFGCTSARLTVTATVNTTPSVTSTTPGVRCDAGTVVLGATASAGTLNWYASATGGSILGTGTSFTTPSLAVTTTYYVEAATATCTSSRTAVTATVNTTPSITSTSPGSRCDAGTVNLGATSSAGVISWFANPTGGTALGTGTTFTTPSISTTTIFYAEVTNTGCTSGRTAVTATVNTTPTITSTTPAFRCDAGIVTLNATASAGNINWYAAATGVTSLATGGTYSPNVSTTTTFYVEASTTTCTSTRTPVTATVGITPTFTSTSPGSRCDPGTIVIGATVNVGTISWFANPTGGTALGTGTTFVTPSVSATTTFYAEATNGSCTTPTRTPVVAAISASLTINGVPGSRCDAGTVTLAASASGGVLSWYTSSSGGSAIATGSPFTTPSLSATTTYYVEANAGTCSSARIPVVATVNITPSITSTTSGSRCDAGTVVLGATASGGTISWYDVATGGTALGTGTSFTTPSISTTTTYYVEASLGGCNNGRTAVTATVNTTPSITSTTPASRCDAGTLTLSATANAGTISWFANATGGVALGTGSSFTTPVINATTTYYVGTATTTCTSTRTAVTAQVTITPSITSTTPGSNCGPGTVTLLATASSGATINWYDALTGGTLLGTGASFTTPSISTTTTYYVEATNSGCTFARTAVTATIKTIPTVTSVTPGSRCNTGSVVLAATTSSGNINWYTAATGGSPIGTGTTFTTPSLSATTVFYAEAADLGCFSTRTPVTATVNATPNITATAPASRCGAGTVVLGATASVGVLNWYIVPTGGTIQATGATFTTPSISTTTTYYVEANNGGCISSRLPIVATVNPIPTISATAGSRCDAGTVTLNATSNIGTISWFTAATGGTAIATGPSYTTGSLSATTTYYVEAATATCTSSRIAVNANVFITPSILTTTPGSRCGTGAVTLAATASGGTILWYAAATGGSPIATGGTYAPSLANTTTFFVEANNNGCAQARVPVVATINQLPSAIIAGPQSVCANAVVYYSLGNVVGNISTYTWTCTGGTITSGQGTSAITVTWAAAGAGSLSCTMTTIEGCSAGTPSFTITKNALPTPSFTGNTTVCTNVVNTYTASTFGNTYIWVPLDGAIVSQTGNTVDILWNNVASSTLTLTEVLATGCSASSTQTITITGPVSATITGNGQVCNNSTQTYTLNGPAATSWTAVGGNITTSSATSATVQWNTVGVQSITANYTNGACSYSVTSTINVNALPTPVVIGSNHGCTGSTYTYSTINNGGRGFSWNVSSNGTILNGQGTNTITVLWNTAGGGLVSVNETVIATGCSVTSGALVLNILNTPSSTISGLAVGCSGVPTTYTASAAATYAWSITGGVINGAANAQTVSVTWGTGVSGALTLTSSNSSANGSCSSTTTLPVNINITPSPVITGPNSLCSGTTTAFTTGFNNRYNYTWNVINATYTFGGNNNVINVTPNTGATSVTIAVTVNVNGSTCTGTATKILAVNATPTISLSGNNNVCQNSTQTYTATGGSTYNFSVTSGTIVSTTANTVTVQWGLYSGAVNVTGASAAGCTGNATFPVNVNPLPGATIIGSSVVCANTTMNYSVASQAGMTYSWTVTGGNLVGSGSGNAITVNWGAAGTGSVKVTLTNTSLCNDSRTMNVNISAIPAPAITGASTVCQGATQTYSVTAAAGAAYNWSVTGGNVLSGSGTNSITVLWTSAGSRNVSVAQSNGTCTGNANAAITVNSAPAIPTVFRAGAQLSTNAVATSYQWFKDGVAVTGATSANYTAAAAGTYTVVVTNSSGCSTSSTGVIANVGIKNNTFMSNVNVFPNPASSSITISALMKKSQDITLNIFDINGKLVYTTLSVNADLNFAKTISLDGLSSGIYVIQLVSAEGMIQERFVKE